MVRTKKQLRRINPTVRKLNPDCDGSYNKIIAVKGEIVGKPFRLG